LLGGGPGQPPETLESVDAGSELTEDGGGIAGAGADLEHRLAPAEVQGLDHEGHDIGLGDGLTLPDGQGTILVGPGL
jgi:hypothetical protein